MNTFESIDSAYISILSSILADGNTTAPRCLDTIELTPFSFALCNPLRRCVSISERNWNLPLAVGEFCWHTGGSRELTQVEYYAKRWHDFSDDGTTIAGSCYGYKIFGADAHKGSQWQRVVEVLRQDPSSRRAVIYLSDFDSDLYTSKDVPCATFLQFLVREGKLSAFLSMRSNDAIWGLPYDVFVFTMLQEMLAQQLGLALGSYYHCANSMHVYKRHIPLAKAIVETKPLHSFEMPPMGPLHQLSQFLNIEKLIRMGSAPTLQNENDLDDYWGDLVGVLKWFAERKRGTIGNPGPKASPYLSLLNPSRSSATVSA